MATVVPTEPFQSLRTQRTQPLIVKQWPNLGNGDDGTPIEFGDYADRTVQITGTFGAGGTVVLEGTIDGTNYATLTDQLGNAMSFTAADLAPVMEAVYMVRPRVTAGDGTTDLTVSLLLRREVV